jgi:hypothetical protein
MAIELLQTAAGEVLQFECDDRAHEDSQTQKACSPAVRMNTIYVWRAPLVG